MQSITKRLANDLKNKLVKQHYGSTCTQLPVFQQSLNPESRKEHNINRLMKYKVMTDITKCTNTECKLSDTCYRFTSQPSEYQQSYARFEPFLNKCDKYILNDTDISKHTTLPRQRTK